MKTSFKIVLVILFFAGATGIILFSPLNKATTDASKASPAFSDISNSSDIIINEVMSNNKGYYPYDQGNNSDWAELYNTTDSDINLQNYVLTGKIDKPKKRWPFPSIILKAHSYLVVFLTGDSNSDLQNGIIHFPFKISSSGESLYLIDPTGQIADSVDIPSLPANVSYGRVNEQWQQINDPTPGFENSDAGYSAFRASMTVQNPPVLITEVMSKNRMTIIDGQGNYSDWVEISNVSNQDVNLNGYGLSDKPNIPLKWKFPSVTLKPGDYFTVFCSGTSVTTPGKELHANFKLSSSDETVTLADPRGRLMDSVKVNALSADWSYGRIFQNEKPTDRWQQTSQPSPGYPNTEEGFEEFLKNNPIHLGDIIISEVMTSNTKIDFEGDKKTYGYIEIENRGQSVVDLKGYGLTNNAANPLKFKFPDIALQPGKQILVLTSGINAQQSSKMKNMQAPFKLNRLGDTLSLFNPQGQLLDRYFLGVIPSDVSIGREEGKTDLYYFTTSTPGQANNVQGFVGIAHEVQFNKQAGKYNGSVQLSLSSPDGSDIYYTLDGNTPSQNSTKYTGPITISQTTAVRAKAFKTDYLPSTVLTSTYFINTSHTLPLVSIVTDPALLFDPKTGIYELGPNATLIPGSTNPPHYQTSNYLVRGKASERPASFEVFDENGKQVFEQNISVRIQGGFSRDNQQKSLAIFARSAYGLSTMNYSLFPDQPYTSYKSIQLRDGGQADLYAKINEEVILNLVRGKIDCLTQNIRPYVVYINGQYWGVYFMEEKRNQNFVMQHADISDNANINLLVGSGMSSDPLHLKNGTNSGYKALLNYVQTHNMSQKANFDYVAAQFDTDSYMDEMINEIYVANSDYYNMEFYQIPGGKWKQIFYDFCWTLRDPTHTTLALRMSSTSNAAALRYMFDGLLQYEPWKEAFLKRFAWTIENIYPTPRVLDTINQVANSIASEMPTERAKFTDENTNWNSQVDILRTFAKQRPYNMLLQLKSVFNLTGQQLRGYFDFSGSQLKTALNLSDTQMQSIFGMNR